MQIDPAVPQLKSGCAKYPNRLKGMSERVYKTSREFFEMEKNNTPYLVFPELFSQFEVFYPAVDILDEKQRNHSTNTLLGVINGNMERLFRIPIYQNEIIIPKEFALSVDFQYDQLNPITSQTFDPNNVPKWECPHYVPCRPKRRKSTTEDRGVAKKRFKVKKAF